jgi:transcriptional regulator with XRE-family HTH domain
MPFGETVRTQRLAKNISLRKFAKMIDVSAPYLSHIERGIFPAPGKRVVRAIAEILAIDPDLLLADAGTVSDDLLDIIKSDPIRFAKIIRDAGESRETRKGNNCNQQF